MRLKLKNLIQVLHLKTSRPFSTQVSSEIFETYVRRTSSIKSITSFRNILILQKDSDQKLKYPLVWLRDNCNCEMCFHASSRSRIINWENFQVNPKLQNIVVSNHNQ